MTQENPILKKLLPGDVAMTSAMRVVASASATMARRKWRAPPFTMDRHSFLSCLPFVVAAQGLHLEEADDPFIADPSHVVLKNLALSVEVESHGVCLFDATGVSSDIDPGLSSCQVYLESSKLCLKIAGRLYFVDWTHIQEVVVEEQGQLEERPPYILLRCCCFRIFSLQQDEEANVDKYRALAVQLTSLLSSETARPDLPTHVGIGKAFSAAGSSSDSTDNVSPGSQNGPQSPLAFSRKRRALQSSQEGMRSLIAALELPSSEVDSLPAREVFNLLNTIADDMNASYMPKQPEDGDMDGQHDSAGMKRACPEHVWADYFPAPRAKSSKASAAAKDKEHALQATREWMEEQKRLVRDRHEALLAPTRG